MLTMRTAGPDDTGTIHRLAHEIWWPTYGDILSQEQIAFMLDNMYSEAALTEQLKQDYVFVIAEREERPVGFAAWACTDSEEKVFKLHKIYLLPAEQGKGTGKRLISYIEGEVIKRGARILELNVNRNNPALHFYERMGFTIYREEDIPYYQYFMNDYIMRKQVRTDQSQG